MKTLDVSRRVAFTRSLILAGALAAPVWVKPVVQSVILPAHAQTSRCSTGPDDAAAIEDLVTGFGSFGPRLRCIPVLGEMRWSAELAFYSAFRERRYRLTGVALSNSSQQLVTPAPGGFSFPFSSGPNFRVAIEIAQPTTNCAAASSAGREISGEFTLLIEDDCGDVEQVVVAFENRSFRAELAADSPLRV